ncbi:MAG: DUF2325 domain-containing protein [Candidatus Binatia bacterium]
MRSNASPDLNNQFFPKPSPSQEKNGKPGAKTVQERVLFKGEKVLLVGGMDRLRAQYIYAVESMGAKCDRHSGSLHQGKKGLLKMIRNVDIVLCSISHNSHNACQSLKSICQGLDKPFYILYSSGVSQVKRTLEQVAREKLSERVTSRLPSHNR